MLGLAYQDWVNTHPQFSCLILEIGSRAESAYKGCQRDFQYMKIRQCMKPQLLDSNGYLVLTPNVHLVGNGWCAAWVPAHLNLSFFSQELEPQMDWKSQTNASQSASTVQPGWTWRTKNLPLKVISCWTACKQARERETQELPSSSIQGLKDQHSHSPAKPNKHTIISSFLSDWALDSGKLQAMRAYWYHGNWTVTGEIRIQHQQ